MHILNNYVLLNILLLFVIKSNHHFQTERYLFFIFNPRTSRHWIINYSFQSRQGRQTWAGETGGLEINISIIFTLYIYFHQTARQRNLLFYSGWLSCHDPCAISSKLQHQRAATLDPVWPPIEIRIMACWRVEGAAPSPAQPSPGHQKLICCREIPALSPLSSQE